jgi:hypothetical protein
MLPGDPFAAPRRLRYPPGAGRASMKINVEKLGRLQEASFDLSRDLLVFVGPNNTSKTYAAYLIYGLFSQDLPPHRRLVEDGEYAFSLFGLPSSPAPTSVPLEVFIDRFAQSTLDALMAERGNDLVKDLFAAANDLFRDTQVRVVLEADDLARLRERMKQRRISQQRGDLVATKAPGSLVVGLGGEAMPDFGDFHEVLVELVQVTLAQAFRKAAILPAERSAIQLFSRELLLSRSEAFERRSLDGSWGRDGRSMADLIKNPQRYPRPIRDTLKIAGDLAALRARSAPFADLARHLEEQILQGSVRVSDEGQLSYTPDGSDTALDIHLASSSVKSLSLLTFYLRHVLDEGDLLIMDEPELNLHPDNQRRVARLLARLVRAGVRVIISTHSDYVIRELNNLIMLSADEDGALRGELSYDDAEILRPEQVGVYLFSPIGVEAVPVDRTGFSVQTIDQEINRLNLTAEKIFRRLFGEAG